MRKLTAIPLLILITISLFGYYSFYAFEIYKAKKSAKQEILKQIPDSLLVKISVNELISWEEEGEELRFNGEMYDVVRMVSDRDENYFLCISDKKEDALFKGLSKIIRINTGAGTNGKHNSNLKVQIVDIICNNLGNPFETDIKKYTLSPFYSYDSRLYLTFKKITTPPPQNLI